MSGTYTVGGTLPDFPTFQDACDSLQNLGISAAVIIAIRDGVYNETVVLDSVPGISALNTVTFRSENLDSSKVTINGGAGTAFEGYGPHYRFEDLSFKSTSNSNSLELYNTWNLVVNRCNLYNDTTLCCNDVLLVNNYSFGAGQDVTNVSILNSSWNGSAGLAIVSDYGDVRNVMIDNCRAYSRNSDAIYLYAEIVLSNISITGCEVICITRDAITMEGYVAADSIEISNTTIDAYDEGVTIYSDDVVENISISNVDVNALAPLGTISNYAFDIEGYYNSTRKISFDAITIDSMANGIYLYSDFYVSDISIDDGTMTSINGYGIYFEGSFVKYENVSINDAGISGPLGNAGIGGFSSSIGKNVSIMNSTVNSANSNGLELESDGSLDMIQIGNSSFTADTTCCDENLLGAYGGFINDVTILNSDFTGNTGFYADAMGDITNMTLDSSDFDGADDGLHLFSATGDIQKVNSNYANCNSSGGEALQFESNNGSIGDVMINALVAASDQSPGCTFYANSGIHDLTFSNSTVDGPNAYGVELYSYYSPDLNITFDNNVITSFYDAIYYYHDNTSMDNLNFTNNDLSSTASNYYGVFLYGDNCSLNDVVMEGNTVTSGFGLYAEAGVGGIANSSISNNDISLTNSGGYGIEFYYAGANNMLNDNMIQVKSPNTLMSTGIYVDGSYNLTDSLLISGNRIGDYVDYGIYVEYSLANLWIKNNHMTGFTGGSWEGIYIYEVSGDEFVVSGNQVYGAGTGGYAFDIEYAMLNSGKWADISNNMISGYGQACYFYASDFVAFNHNTFNIPDDNTDAVYFDWSCNNLNILNNIFETDSANYSYTLFVFEEQSPVSQMNNNIALFDTTVASYVYNSWYGYYYYSISEWNDSTGFDSNSFYQDVNFLNDSFDLHVPCNQASLNAGQPGSGVSSDIDGSVRDPLSPTIGADEILSNSNILETDSVSICMDPVAVEAPFEPGASYSWSNGASTQQTYFTGPGTLIVTVTNTCGSFKDTVVAAAETQTSAAFSSTTSFQTASFTNLSTNANSYVWDFGDGNSGSDVNPVHVYTNDSTYTVTLISYGDCENDTISQQVTVSSVGIGLSGANAIVSVYPNPSRGNLLVSMSGFPNKNIRICITNLQGKEVISRFVETNGPMHPESFDLTAFPGGVYLLNIFGENLKETSKFVLLNQP